MPSDGMGREGGIMETMTEYLCDMRCGQTGESKTERELKIAGREGQREGNVKKSESIVASPCHTGQGKEKNHHNQGQPPPPGTEKRERSATSQTVTKPQTPVPCTSTNTASHCLCTHFAADLTFANCGSW